MAFIPQIIDSTSELIINCVWRKPAIYIHIEYIYHVKKNYIHTYSRLKIKPMQNNHNFQESAIPISMYELYIEIIIYVYV